MTQTDDLRFVQVCLHTQLEGLNSTLLLLQRDFEVVKKYSESNGHFLLGNAMKSCQALAVSKGTSLFSWA